MPRLISAAAVALGLLASGAAWAAPGSLTAQSPMDTDRIMGRWYEILRMPNKVQRNCFAAYQVWSKKPDGFAVQQVCHRDSAEGKLAEITVSAKAINADNTLFDTSFFGGMIHQKYLLIDHAPDYSWLISTTADGRFPKVLFRSPAMPAAQQADLRRRLSQLGFDVGRMEFCGEGQSPQ